MATDANDAKYRNIILTYILNSAPNKLPIKSTDLLQLALNDKVLFKRAFELAKNALLQTYGIVIKEVAQSSTGKKYICLSEIKHVTMHSFNADQRRDITLLALILTYIHMKGGVVTEDQLFKHLYDFRIDVNVEHKFFGDDLKKLITDTYVKQLYLKREKEVSDLNHDEFYSIAWGFRSECEFEKMQLLKFVAEIMDRPIISFTAQYEDAQKQAQNAASQSASSQNN